MEDFCFSFNFAVKDIPGKSQLTSVNPFVQVLNNEDANVGQSKVIRNEDNPKWTGVQVPVNRLTFGLQENDASALKAVFQVYDYNFAKKDDLIGSVCVELSDIFEVQRTKKPKSWILDEQDNQNCIFILLAVEQTENTTVLESTEKLDMEKVLTNKVVEKLEKLKKEDTFHLLMKISAIGLVKTEFVGKMNPMFKVFTLDKKRNVIYRSESVPKNANPDWKMFSLGKNDFAPDWKFKQLIFKVYDRNRLGMSEVIGRVEFNSTILIAAAIQNVSLKWRLFKPSRLKRSVFRLKGKLKLEFALANQEIPTSALVGEDNSIFDETVFQEQTKDADEIGSDDEDFEPKESSSEPGVNSSDVTESLPEVLPNRNEGGSFDSAADENEDDDEEEEEEKNDDVPEIQVPETVVVPAQRKKSTPVMFFDITQILEAFEGNDSQKEEQPSENVEEPTDDVTHEVEQGDEAIEVVNEDAQLDDDLDETTDVPEKDAHEDNFNPQPDEANEGINDATLVDNDVIGHDVTVDNISADVTDSDHVATDDVSITETEEKITDVPIQVEKVMPDDTVIPCDEKEPISLVKSDTDSNNYEIELSEKLRSGNPLEQAEVPPDLKPGVSSDVRETSEGTPNIPNSSEPPKIGDPVSNAFQVNEQPSTGAAKDPFEHDNSATAIYEVNSVEDRMLLEAVEETQSSVVKSTKAARIAAELKDQSDCHFIIKFRAFDLADTDVVGQSDALLEVSTLADKVIYKSEVLKNNLNPRWKPFSIPLSKIAPKNRFENLVIKVYDYNVIGKNDLLGIIRFNGKLLVAAARQHVALTWKLYEKPGLVISGTGKEKLRGKLQLQYVFANRRLPEECDIPGLQDSMCFFQKSGSIFSQYDPEDPQQMEISDFYKAEGKCDFYGERDETAIFKSLKSSGLMDKKMSSKDDSESDEEPKKKDKDAPKKKVKPSARKSTSSADVTIVGGVVTLNKKEEPKMEEKPAEDEPKTEEEKKPDSHTSEVPELANEEPKPARPSDVQAQEEATVTKPPADPKPVEVSEPKKDSNQDPPSSPEIVSSTEFEKMNQEEKQKDNKPHIEGGVTLNKDDGLKIEGFEIQECNGDGKDNFVAIEKSDSTEAHKKVIDVTNPASGDKKEAAPENIKPEEAPAKEHKDVSPVSEREVTEPTKADSETKDKPEEPAKPAEMPKATENVGKKAVPEPAKVHLKPEEEKPTEKVIREQPKVEKPEMKEAKEDMQTKATESKNRSAQSQGEETSSSSSSSSIAFVVLGLIAVVAAVAVYHWRSDS